MLLRWLVNNYLREAAEGKVRDVVAGVMNPSAPAPPGERSEGRRERPALEEGEAGEQPAPELLPCDAVFVFGSGMEAGGLVDLLKGSERSKHAHGIEHAGKLAGREVVVIESGEGAKASARAVTEAIKFYQPAWVISAGFAAALDGNFKRGHIVLADEVQNEQGEKLAVGLKVDPQSLAKGVSIGRLLSVSEVVRHPADRRRLAEQHAAIACDMETFAIAQACQQHNVRLLAVRIITDALDDELPPEIAHLLKQKTIAAKIGATAGALLNRFSAAQDLWQLREDALKASDRLAKFLQATLSQLPTTHA